MPGGVCDHRGSFSVVDCASSFLMASDSDVLILVSVV